MRQTKIKNYTMKKVFLSSCFKFTFLIFFLWLCGTLNAQHINNVIIVDVSGCDPLAKNGSIEITSVSGGSIDSYTYRWEKIDDDTFVNQGAPSISALDTGRYVVTVSDGVASESRNFTITASDYIRITCATPLHVLCKDELTGRITAQITGNPASRIYTLLNEDKTPNSNITGASSGIFIGIHANTYHLAVMNSASCTDTVTVTINEPAERLSLFAMQSDLVSCDRDDEGDDHNVHGDLTVTINGGVGSYTLEIIGADQNTINTIPDLIAGEHIFTDYNVDPQTTVRVTDANGCTAEKVLDVREMQKPVITELHIYEIKCYNDKGIIYIFAEAYNEAGTNNSIKKYWIKGEIFQETEPKESNEFEYMNGGFYYLYVQDSYGCIGEEEIFLSEPKSPVELTLKNTTPPLGNVNGSITFTASGGWEGYTIECKKVESGHQPVIETLTNKPAGDYTFGNLKSGEYLFTIEDEKGCFGQHHLIWLGSTTGEADTETAGLKIFPNPSSDGQFIIEWDSNDERQVTLELYNINGQLIYKNNTRTGTRFTIDISSQKQGTYLLHVPEMNIQQKLVIY